MLQHTGKERIFDVLRKIFIFNMCEYNDDRMEWMMETILEVEKHLQIQSSEKRFKDISHDILNTASEIFIYIFSLCHDDKTAEKWFFYRDLFQNHSSDIIILTLNRMSQTLMNTEINQKLIKRTATLLRLKYEIIQNMLQGKSNNNSDMNHNNSLEDFRTKGKYGLVRTGVTADPSDNT